VKTSLARLVFPSLRWRPSSGGFNHERTKIDAALAAGVGGFIIFGAPREGVATLTAELRNAAGRALLIGSDFERGPAQQVTGLSELPPPAALGALGDLEITGTCGLITAVEARSVGINWAFAPVCDLDLEPKNPIVGTRSFGTDPEIVGEHAAMWVRGCQEHGVLASAKHYPGHGRTTQDSHATLPRVTTPLKTLEATDLVPFASAVRAGVGSVMSAFVSYPGWDASGRAASFSPVMLDYLRQSLGFDGIVVSDALIMAGATAQEREGPATTRAVAAGCDALLYPQDFARVVAALDAAVGAPGGIPTARADQALQRIANAAEQWSGGADQGGPDLATHAAFADGVADRVTQMLRGEPPSLHAPLSLPIVDDDVGGPYMVGPRDVLEGELRKAGVDIGQRTTGNVQRVVLVYSEPRSWKGRADLGPASQRALARLVPGAALVILFGHPRLVAQIPGKVPVLGCWHGMPLMQRAAGRWILQRLSAVR
jgi:beta-glucosidase